MNSNLFSLNGKVALVTGAAYGIGFAIAEALAEAGAKIAFNCRKPEHLQSALDDYSKLGIEARGYLCDVTKEDEVKAMVAELGDYVKAETLADELREAAEGLSEYDLNGHKTGLDVERL